MTGILAGTLVRYGPGEWRWSDGTPEPRVKDLREHWNFRCRTDGTGQTYAEVLRGVAQEESDLAWVLEGARAGRYRSGASGDHTGPVVLTDDGLRRSHIRPGEDPLHGNEPMPEVPGPIPRVILVPIEEWDEHWREHPLGAEWDAADEVAILSRAYELGWRPPKGWVSPQGWRPPEVSE